MRDSGSASETANPHIELLRKTNSKAMLPTDICALVKRVDTARQTIVNNKEGEVNEKSDGTHAINDNEGQGHACRINNLMDGINMDLTIQEEAGETRVRHISSARKAHEPDAAVCSDHAQDLGYHDRQEMAEHVEVNSNGVHRVNNQASSSQGAQHHLSLVDIDMVSVRRNNMQLRGIYNTVASTNQPNHRAARISLPSDLNVQKWRSELRGYHDYKIVEYLEYGWQIGIDQDAVLQSHYTNHPSATAHARDVSHYIATELGHGALLGPFAGPPTGNCHFSPLMTRTKKDSIFRRVIIDLSWPQGRSINDGISRREYVDGPMTISLPTTDDMERAVVAAGRGSFMYKTDLSRGYRQLRVDPLDWPLLSFQHESMCYMDICPPFGLRSSAMAMQRTLQAIIYLHERRGFISRAYIDDFGGVEPEEARATSALGALQGVMEDLGVVQAPAKICQPSQRMVWLGIQFDTWAMSMQIPEAKMGEIMECLRRWQTKSRATRKELQSLLGLLNFVASVAKPTRLFTNRMLDTLREAPQQRATSLSYQFKQDVLFFVELLPIFNGRRIMGKRLLPYQHQVELDACLTGCGAVAGDQYYATPFPSDFIKEGHTIAHLEMLNIAVAIKVWSKRWAGWTVQIYCDNLNSVCVLQTGKSRDEFMRGCAREVFLYTAACDIDVQVCHRPGVDMIWADALSREHTSSKYADRVRNDDHLKAATRLQVPSQFFDIRNEL